MPDKTSHLHLLPSDGSDELGSPQTLTGAVASTGPLLAAALQLTAPAAQDQTHQGDHGREPVAA